MRTAFLLVLTALVLSPQAAAQRQTTDLGPPTAPTVVDLHHASISTQARSGDTAERQRRLIAPDGAWVYGISIGEKSDQPCYLGLWWATIDDGGTQFGYSQFAECNGEPNSSSLTAVGMNTVESPEQMASEWPESLEAEIQVYEEMADYIAAQLNGGTPRIPVLYRSGTEEPTALKSVQVCQRSSNDEMKGLRVRGVELQIHPALARGRTRPVRDTNGSWVLDGVTRSNCNEWQTQRECPGGHVLVGTQIHYDDGNNAKIKGLAPICARLTIDS